MTTRCPLHRTLVSIFVLCCAPAGILRADGKTEPPVPVRTVPPDIPAEFSRGGGTGLVTVNFLVDEQGGVHYAKEATTTEKSLDEPALKAVRKWKFKPAKKDGTPVAIRVSIPIKFEVQ